MMTQMFNVANGDRPDVPDTAIVITDGRSTYDSNLTIPYANEAKARGIRIIGTCLSVRPSVCPVHIFFISVTYDTFLLTEMRF